jgi:very-short-patch-repair endonuclease
LGKVRVASVEDALLGFAAVSGDRKAVEIAVESVLLANKTTERKLWRHIGLNSRSGVRGIALLRSVIENRPFGKPARSILEIELFDLLRKRKIPLSARNVDVIDANGDRREIDLCYLDQKGAIEADSRRWHSTESQTAQDSRRQRALEAVGFEFVRVTWADVFQRPDWVVSEVQRLLLRVVAA